MEGILQSMRELYQQGENLLKIEWEKLEEEKVKLEVEKNKFEEISGKMSQISLTKNKVTLNVGGTKFTTSKETLTKFPNSVLFHIVSGQFNIQPDEDGEYFIDRDPTHFGLILNFLRKNKITIDDLTPRQIEDLLDEVDFYGLVELMNLIKECLEPTEPAEDSIITAKHWEFLINSIGEPKNKWNRCYKASKDGYSPSDFHRCVDNKGATVTVISVQGGTIFGGYTSKSWTDSPNDGNSPSYWRNDPKAFLFVLDLKGTPVYQLLKIKKPNEAYGWYRDEAPCFGYGHTIEVRSKTCIVRMNDQYSFEQYPLSGSHTILDMETFVITNE